MPSETTERKQYNLATSIVRALDELDDTCKNIGMKCAPFDERVKVVLGEIKNDHE